MKMQILECNTRNEKQTKQKIYI